MRKKFGLKLAVSQESMERIQAAELIRDLVVHTGSRISGEYVKRTGRTDLTLGQKVAISRDTIGQLYSDIKALALEVFLDVSEVHLGKKRETVLPLRPRTAYAD